MSSGETFRHTADYHPSLWGNHFLKGASGFKTVDHTATQERHEALKEEVRRMITDAEDKPVQKLRLIDEVQRLGVAYHFEKEIEDAIQKLCPNYIDSNSPDLHTVSLHFRLLRPQGIKISCDVFEKFKDDEGRFKSSLINDVQGMLSLYEAAYMATRGEDILDEAIAFTTTHLKSLVAQDHVTPKLAEQINHALYRPLRKTLPRLEARYFMSMINSTSDHLHNKTLLNFAKLDFNILLELHKEELNELTKWWKDLDFTTKLPYARDRLVELYFWDLGTYFEPQYAFGRKIMTQLNYILSIIDDTYDAYGTLEELSLFTEAVQRWNIEAVDMLPEYMKLIYRTLLDAFNEIEEDMAKQGRSHCVRYAKEAFEQKRGHVASAIECYTKQHGVSKEEAIKMFEEEVANAWKDINEELMMKPTVAARPLLGTILNLARAIDFIYKEDDGYTHSYLIKDQIASVLGDHVPF